MHAFRQLKQSDGDEERKGVFVSDEEEHELSGSKVSAESHVESMFLHHLTRRCPSGHRTLRV